MAPVRTARKDKRPPFAWTQPCCSECWTGLKLKIGRPQGSDAQHCCFCRVFIGAGEIYHLRVNPGTVPYPTLRKEED